MIDSLGRRGGRRDRVIDVPVITGFRKFEVSSLVTASALAIIEDDVTDSEARHIDHVPIGTAAPNGHLDARPSRIMIDVAFVPIIDIGIGHADRSEDHDVVNGREVVPDTDRGPFSPFGIEGDIFR